MQSFLKVSLDDIRGSGIGKVLMMLKESKHEVDLFPAQLSTSHSYRFYHFHRNS